MGYYLPELVLHFMHMKVSHTNTKRARCERVLIDAEFKSQAYHPRPAIFSLSGKVLMLMPIGGGPDNPI